MKSNDLHGDFKVELDMEENVKNSDFLENIDDEFFTEEMIDPFASTNDAGA